MRLRTDLKTDDPTTALLLYGLPAWRQMENVLNEGRAFQDCSECYARSLLRRVLILIRPAGSPRKLVGYTRRRRAAFCDGLRGQRAAVQQFQAAHSPFANRRPDRQLQVTKLGT